MTSVNKVILVGNLGADPEVRSLPDGKKVVNINLATSESWKDRGSGERKERTEWHRVVVINDTLGDFAEKYLTKGKKVYVEGALQTRKWTDKDGKERHSTEVFLGRFNSQLILLTAEGGGERRSSETREGPRQSSRSTKPKEDDWGKPTGDLDDEIPF